METFKKVEQGAVVKFWLSDNSGYGSLLVESKDERDGTVRGVLLSRRNALRIFRGERIDFITLDTEDLSNIISFDFVHLSPPPPSAHFK